MRRTPKQILANDLVCVIQLFSNLMLAYYAPDKSEQGIANQQVLNHHGTPKTIWLLREKYSGVKGDANYW